MTWCVGILTWNAAEQCRATIAALRQGLTGSAPVLVLDNGSSPPFVEPTVDVRRSATNLGAGGGLSLLVTEMLATGSTHLLCLEDDWRLDHPLALDALEPLLEDDAVGQVRLGVRANRPSRKYWTFGLDGAEAERAAAQADATHHAYRHGTYQRARLLWSNNPFACRRAMAERFLLGFVDEIKIARPYYAADLVTISTTPGHFVHTGGDVRSRRGQPGWTK